MSSTGKTILVILGLLLAGLLVWQAWDIGVLILIHNRNKEMLKEQAEEREYKRPEELRMKITKYLTRRDFSKARTIAGSDEDAFVDCAAAILTKEYEKNGADGVFELLVAAALTPGSEADIRMKASVKTLRQYVLKKGDISGARTFEKYLENE